MNAADHKTQFEVNSQFRRLKELFETGFFQDTNNISHPFYRSVFIEVLIVLDDLLQKTKGKNRVAFKDDIPQNMELHGDRMNDITDLIRYFRNTVCHTNNDKRNIDNNIVSFVWCAGLKPEFIQINGHQMGCAHEDDACLIMGNKQIYIKRHLNRAFDELKTFYLSYPEFDLERIFR